MDVAAVVGISYGAGAVVFVTASAAWFEFHRALGKFQHFMAARDFYFRTGLLALLWPVGLPAAVFVLAARRRARRLLAAREEQARIDRIVEAEMRRP